MMKIFGVFLCLALTITFVNCKSISKRQAENEVSPSNEVYVLETEDDATADDERSDRDKRKIGVVKLGVTNGILSFVFGKLDAFLDAKTRALSVLDDSNRAKNVAFGIDPTQSATSQFVSQFLQQKVQAGSNSIGPVVNGATTFLSSAASGLTNALAGKVGSLSSLSGGLSQGAGPDSQGAANIGGLLSSGISALTSLSASSSGGSNGSNGNNGSTNDHDDDDDFLDNDDPALTGADLGAGVEGALDEIEFDRTKVSLDIPPAVFGGGFTLITEISKIAGDVIMNTAHRTERVLELFKPLFRGIFAIKGLPSDKDDLKYPSNY